MDTRTELVDLFAALGFDAAELDEGTRLREELDVDSTELVEIAVAVERRLSVSLESADLMAVQTFGELIDLVESAPTRT